MHLQPRRTSADRIGKTLFSLFFIFIFIIIIFYFFFNRQPSVYRICVRFRSARWHGTVRTLETRISSHWSGAVVCECITANAPTARIFTANPISAQRPEGIFLPCTRRRDLFFSLSGVRMHRCSTNAPGQESKERSLKRK